MNDVVLAIYSDRLFMAAVGVYVLAMVAARAPSTPPLARGSTCRREARSADAPAPSARRRRRRTIARRRERAARRNRRRGAARPAADRRPAAAARAERFGAGGGRTSSSSGALLHLAIARLPRAGHRPLAAGQHVRVHLRDLPRRGRDLAGRAAPAARRCGPSALFVLLPVVVLLFLAGTVLYAQAAPVVPALRSYWLVVHVTTITISSGPAARPGSGEPAVPAAPVRPGRGAWPSRAAVGRDALDRLAYRTTIVAFPIYTFARDRRGDLGGGGVGPVLGLGPQGDRRVRRLGRLRRLPARPRHRGLARRPRRAGSTSSGCAVVLFNLFFVNMVVAGLHSYAGV